MRINVLESRRIDKSVFVFVIILIKRLNKSDNSKFQEKARPLVLDQAKNVFCGLNFSVHLNINLASLCIKNLRIEYFRANCTGLSSLDWSRQPVSEFRFKIEKFGKKWKKPVNLPCVGRLPSPDCNDMLLFSNAKQGYRSWLRDYRHETHRRIIFSPSLFWKFPPDSSYF